MATVVSAPLVSVEEYIARFVEGGEKPLCEYVDGELIPKPMASRQHSRVQKNIIVAIHRSYRDRFEPLPELTTRLREKSFLIPDVAVESKETPVQGRYPGPDDPVFLCVKIKSPPDRIGKLFGKCEGLHAWGVPHCWVIDPDRKVAWEYSPTDEEPRKVQDALTAGPIELALTDIFVNV